MRTPSRLGFVYFTPLTEKEIEQLRFSDSFADAAVYLDLLPRILIDPRIPPFLKEKLSNSPSMALRQIDAVLSHLVQKESL